MKEKTVQEALDEMAANWNQLTKEQQEQVSASLAGEHI